MILLDTNVLSALMRTEPEESVIRWLDEQPFESLWTTSITVFEIRFGIDALPSGRRRDRLEGAFEDVLERDLERRVVPFETSAAMAAGRIAARRRQEGRPVEFRDVEIAGIAIARKATLATRNLRHFSDLGVDLVDPWA